MNYPDFWGEFIPIKLIHHSYKKLIEKGTESVKLVHHKISSLTANRTYRERCRKVGIDS